MTQFEKESYKLRASLIDFKSSFSFLRAHNGFRRGKVHILLGTSGSGKSSLIRAILNDVLGNNPGKNVLLFLSEETRDDLKEALAHALIDFSGKNLWVVSEQEHNDFNSEAFFQMLDVFKRDHDISFFIFDNITTSGLYNDMNPQGQSKFVQLLKRKISEHQIATLIVAHTKSGVSDNGNKLIDDDDIRSNKTIVNLAEFFYILQRFQHKNSFYQTIRLIKHRGQSPSNRMFHLYFDIAQMIYTSDSPINFEIFKEAFNGRNRL